jgi:hypothetical protein
MLKKKLSFIGVLSVIFLIQACGKKDMLIVDQNSDASDVIETAEQNPKETTAANVDDQDEVATEVKIEESEEEEFAETIEQDFVEQISFKYYFKETSSHYIAFYDGVRCVELHYKDKKNNDFWTVTLDRYPKSYKASVSEYLNERCDLKEIVDHRRKSKTLISEIENKTFNVRRSQTLFSSKNNVREFGLSLMSASYEIQSGESIIQKTKKVSYKVGKLHEIMGSNSSRSGDGSFVSKFKWIYFVNHYQFKETNK